MGSGTELGRVRGLGSAREGTHHWWHQRLTAAANLVLMTWFFVSLARLPGFEYGIVQKWMASAWVAIPMALLVLSVLYHARLGLQMLIEDYVHDEKHVVCMVALNAFIIGGGAIAVFSILKIAFGATA